MTRICISLIAFFISLLPSMTADAQVPEKGIVWTPPSRVERAQQDLREMKRIGIEAIRTPLLNNEALYTLADSLQLTLYQDLPFEYLSAVQLTQKIEEGKKVLDSALQAASNHPSAQHFGLTTFSDTRSTESCAFLQELVQHARSRNGNRNTFYYTTYFIEEDACAESVDYVLIDVLDDPNFLEKHQRWSQSHKNTPAGLANLGTWVLTTGTEENLRSGYLQENSPEYQARFLENALERLLSEQGTSIPTAFVYRWRDARLRSPTTAYNLTRPYRHPYGLISSGYQTRHSFDVVRGFYSNTQRIFALPAGKELRPDKQWITVFIWLNLLMLSIVYAYFPRFRIMTRRYFTSHGFFREAIREGRELLIGPNILIFIGLCSAFGLCSIVILEVLRKTESFSLFLRWQPESVSFTTVALLSQPLLNFIVLSGTYGLLLSFWTSALSAISTRSRYTLLPGQSFILVLWSQWPLLLIMIGAGVITSLGQPLLTRMTTILAIMLITVIITGALLTLRDYWFISKSNLALITASLVINPISILLVAAGYYCIQYIDQFLFAFSVMRT